MSLRDGEQQAKLIFSKDQKLALAEKLAEVGIHRIEAGMPAVSPQDEASIKEIVKRDLRPEIFAFCRCMTEDVKRAADCGVTGIVIEIPSSDHLVKYAYGWEMQRAIDLSIESTLCAREHGLYTVFFPIDGSRADIDWFLTLIKKVAGEGHMDALAVVDTFGGLAPTAIHYLIKKVKSEVDKPIEVHFHDDYGLGSANTIMALAAGAEVAHTTISGIGERAGNAPYEDIAMSLLTMYGVDIGLHYDKIYGLSRYLQEVSGLKIRQNQGIIGEDIEKIESGIVAGWFQNAFEEHPLELSPYRYPLTGHPDFEVVIGKNSGTPSIDIYLEKLGLSLEDRALKLKLLDDIKSTVYEKRRLLNLDEFEVMTRKYL